jgi:hypothetical protein
VDRRQPNLRPGDVEVIIGDSIERNKVVGKAVATVVKRLR